MKGKDTWNQKWWKNKLRLKVKRT